MKVKIQGFCGKNHSWAIINQSIARWLAHKGHEVEIISTDGIDHFPKDLVPCLRTKMSDKYDMEVSYTAPKNWPYYLGKSKNRFGIWCYEWPILPPTFAKYSTFCDKILAPSHFARDAFIKSKFPEEKVVVVPHGINPEDYYNTERYPLKTTKYRKILVNIGQPHLRKNISGMFKAYGEAFTSKDDVCLVAKISKPKTPLKQFDVDPFKLYQEYKKKYTAEIELITDYVPNMSSLYHACDIVYTLSHCEGFYMPGLEGMACQKLVIAPRYGGQLDFMNDSNSLLIDGKITRAPVNEQYWHPSLYNTHFDSDIGDAAQKLRQAVFNWESLMMKFLPSIQDIPEKYLWWNVADQIIGLCQ